MNRSRHLGIAKRGTATIELAVSLPILAGLAFGSINAAAAINLKHQAKLISHTGATLAMDNSNDFATVVSKAQTLSNSVGLKEVVVVARRRNDDFVEVQTTIPIGPNNALHRAFPISSEVRATSVTFRPKD